MKTIDIDSVLPGDIIFTARPGKLEKVVRLSTGGEVSHAIICVQKGSFIDSTTNGVQASSLQREYFAEDELVYQFRLKEPASRDTISKIVDYARAEIGARYSVPEAIRSVARVHEPRSRRQFCSRLIARVYAKAGIQLVSDTDYCSPEDLKNSPLLVQVPVVTNSISESEIQSRSSTVNPIEATHKAHNAILKQARAIDPAVETMEDVVALLVRNPAADGPMAEVLASSGYLDLWKIEVSKHPWRYEKGRIDAEFSPDNFQSLQAYCLGTVSEAYSGGIRFPIMLNTYRHLNARYKRKAFELEIKLYETLVRNDEVRREIAYDWLNHHFREDLNRHMEQIEPHGEQWLAIIDQVQPRLAAMSRYFVAASATTDVCTLCGDEPSERYRLANGADTMLGVPSLRLCDDCLKHRRDAGEIWLAFLR